MHSDFPNTLYLCKYSIVSSDLHTEPPISGYQWILQYIICYGDSTVCCHKNNIEKRHFEDKCWNSSVSLFKERKERKGKKETKKTHYVLYQANSETKIKYITVSTSLYKQMKLTNDIQLLKELQPHFQAKNMQKKSLKHSNTEFNPMQSYKTQNSIIHTYLKFTVTSLHMACVFTK